MKVEKTPRLSAWRRRRLRLVMWVARRLAVPIDVHGSFFRSGKNDFNTPACATAPK